MKTRKNLNSIPLFISLAFLLLTIAIITVSQSQAQVLSPLEEDQDNDGDPLNEEDEISFNCVIDQDLVMGTAEQFGIEGQVETTLSENDCNFVMHYLSGQCEELTARGANVTGVCDESLADYLEKRDLLTKDFPTDKEQFTVVLDEFKQKRALEEQENAAREANTPSWTEGFDN